MLAQLDDDGGRTWSDHRVVLPIPWLRIGIASATAVVIAVGAFASSVAAVSPSAPGIRRRPSRQPPGPARRRPRRPAHIPHRGVPARVRPGAIPVAPARRVGAGAAPSVVARSAVVETRRHLGP